MTPVNLLQVLGPAMPEASAVLSQVYEPIGLFLFPLSCFELDSCHLSMSHEEHIIIQGDTRLP